jgi:hypothetical protein
MDQLKLEAKAKKPKLLLHEHVMDQIGRHMVILGVHYFYTTFGKPVEVAEEGGQRLYNDSSYLAT